MMKSPSPAVHVHFHVALDNEGLKRRSIRGSIVTGLAQMLKLAISVGSQIVLAQLLFPSDFGLLAMVYPDHGKNSLREFTQRLPHRGVRAAISAAARRAAAVSPAEDAAATEENVALVRRFVPEVIRDVGTGTLIAQQSCGTIDRL